MLVQARLPSAFPFPPWSRPRRAQTLRQRQPANPQVVCLGDGVTGGWAVPPAETWCGLVGGINRGTNGQTAAQGLARFQADVVDAGADVVAIVFGLNDHRLDRTVAEYSENIRTMVQLACDAGIRPIVLTPTPRGDDRNAELWRYVESIAARTPRWWTRSAWWARSGRAGVVPLTDVLHPNAYSHARIAGVVGQVLARPVGCR